MSSKKVQKFAIGFASVVAALVVASAVANAGDDSSAAKPVPTPSANTAPQAPAEDEGDSKPLPDPIEKTPLQEFQACVADGGTPTEKAAVKHVTKLSGMDDWNGILDNPKVWTDYTGGLFKHASDAELIASAFADCYKSDNGLVTIFDRDGHVAGNGRF